MIVTIKNADFSSVKIGTAIEIPKALKPAISSFGDLSDKQIGSLVNLYNNLSNAGYWDRIEKLYIPSLASSLNKTHINIKDGVVDWVPGTKYRLEEGLGIASGSSSGDGDTYVAYERNAKNITSFSMIFSNVEFVGTSTTSILGLRNEYDSSTQRQFTPYFLFNTENNALKLISVYNSLDSQSITIGNKNNQLTAFGHISDKNYFLAGMGVYETIEATYAPNGQLSEKLTYYSNINGNLGVKLIAPIAVSGIMDGITSLEYTELNTIFGQFRDSLHNSVLPPLAEK